MERAFTTTPYVAQLVLEPPLDENFADIRGDAYAASGLGGRESGMNKVRKGTDVAGTGALLEDADAMAAPCERKCACETSDAGADDDEVDGEGGGTL